MGLVGGEKERMFADQIAQLTRPTFSIEPKT